MLVENLIKNIINIKKIIVKVDLDQKINLNPK
jgi:hypothetical protein